MGLYQCIKFYLIPFYTFRDISGQAFIAKINKGSNPVNTDDRVAVLAFCTFSDGPLSI